MIGITVFEPANFDTLTDFRTQNPNIEVVVISLDTIRDVAEQELRVGGAPDRIQSQSEIDNIREILALQDVVLSGDEHTIVEAVAAVCKILQSRGGIVTKELLEPLLLAGALLDDFERTNLESASYDLRIGNEIWCHGRFCDLRSRRPQFRDSSLFLRNSEGQRKGDIASFFGWTVRHKGVAFFVGPNFVERSAS